MKSFGQGLAKELTPFWPLGPNRHSLFFESFALITSLEESAFGTGLVLSESSKEQEGSL